MKYPIAFFPRRLPDRKRDGTPSTISFVKKNWGEVESLNDLPSNYEMIDTQIVKPVRVGIVGITESRFAAEHESVKLARGYRGAFRDSVSPYGVPHGDPYADRGEDPPTGRSSQMNTRTLVETLRSA